MSGVGFGAVGGRGEVFTAIDDRTREELERACRSGEAVSIRLLWSLQLRQM